MATTLDRLRDALAGKYEVDREIGAGGMATVYIARDVRHDRDVAVKVLHPDLGAALGGERFLSEIKTTAKLQHPHILPLLDSGEADTLLYYVMPFVVGESLRARIDRERQLPIGEAVRITKEVASALDYAHRHGVIHRDIKPDNILLHDGQALVADFGIALAVTVAGGGRMTQTGLSLGTPQYMSPEQAMGERTIDGRSDIYSLGAVTYEMITGEPPFTGNTVQVVVSKIMTEKPTQMSRIRDTVPEMVESAVNTALSKIPADRFGTAAEYSAALTSHVMVMRSAQNIERMGTEVTAPQPLHRRLITPLAAIALIATALALWGWLRPQPPRQVSRFVLALDSTEAIAGPVGRIALSPDGSTLVFTGGKHELYTRPLNDLHATVIPGANDATAPVFSPDGQQIAFSTPTYQIKVVALKGGLPTLITDSIVGRSGLSWSPDGYIYTVNRSANAIVRLHPAPGSPVEIVTTLDTANGETAHRLPDALPDGKAFLFTVFYGAKGRTGTAIAVQRPGSRTHSILVSGQQARYSPSGHLVYATSNATLMAIRFDPRKLTTSGEPIPIAEGIHVGSIGTVDLAISRNGTLAYTLGTPVANRELIWVTRDGHIQKVDSTWRAFFNDPSLSPDGRHLAVTVGTLPLDIWVKQLDNGPSLKLTFAGTLSENPGWTPDGQSVTYSSNADNSGLASLWNKRADGSAPAASLLRRKDASIAEAVWSRDGKWLVARTSTTASGSGDIFAIHVGADTTLIPVATSKFVEKSPDLSPDGRFLVFSSNETGRDEIFVVPFPMASAAKWAISTAGGTEPRWSHGGGEIFYRDAGGNMISVPVKTSPAFSFGAPKVLFSASEMIAASSHRQYDVSADDQRFVMLRSERSRVPDKLVIVNNWFDELKQGKH